MLKKLTLLLCAIMLFSLAACKDDTTSKGNQNSIVTNLDSKPNTESENTTSGIELEEDVFDDSDIQNNSSENSSSSNVSSNTSNDGTVSDKNESTDNISSDTPIEKPEENVSSKEGITVEDGVVKLPIDKFD